MVAGHERTAGSGPGSSEPPEEAAFYRVGDFIVDVRHELVIREGREIALAKLTFDLLIALVRDAPRLVSVDMLMERVWPGLVVGPETISQRVMKLRVALEDDPKSPHYVAGVRGRGYRIVAPVSAASSPSALMEPLEVCLPGAPVPDVAVGAAPGRDRSLETKPEPDCATERASRPPLRLPTTVLVGGVVGIAIAMVVVLLSVRRASEPSTGTMTASSRLSATTPDTSAEIAPVHTIRLAILPLDNLSPDPANGFFGDGLHEELLTTIAQRLPGIEVISRTTMMTYRHGPARPLGAVARELKATHIIEGTVRREAGRVRLSLQLIDARTDRQLWSHSYDSTLSGALNLQSQVADEVAAQLAVPLQSRASSGPAFTAQNAEAYDAYLKARLAEESLHYPAATLTGYRNVLELLGRAVAADRDFIPARLERLWIGSSMVASQYDTSAARLQQIEEDLRAARRVAGTDPNVLLAQAWYEQVIESDPARALQSVRAAQMAGVDSEGLLDLAEVLLRIGRPEETFPVFERLLALDRYDVEMFRNWTEVLWEAHKPDEALRAINLGLDLHAPLEGYRGQLLFAFTGNLEQWRHGSDLALEVIGREFRPGVEIQLMRFEHRYVELRHLLEDSTSERSAPEANFGP